MSACTIVRIQFISKVEPDSIVASNDAASPPISWPCSLHHSQSSRPVWKVQSADEQELRQHWRRRAPVWGVPGKPEEDRQAQLWGAHLDHGGDQVCWLDQVQILPLLLLVEMVHTPHREEFIAQYASGRLPTPSGPSMRNEIPFNLNNFEWASWKKWATELINTSKKKMLFTQRVPLFHIRSWIQINATFVIQLNPLLSQIERRAPVFRTVVFAI